MGPGVRRAGRRASTLAAPPASGARGLPAGRAVELLPDDVRVAGVAGGLLEEMGQDPTEVDRRLALVRSTEVLERGPGHDLVHRHPRPAVGRNHTLHAVVLSHLVVAHDIRTTREAAEHP